MGNVLGTILKHVCKNSSGPIFFLAIVVYNPAREFRTQCLVEYSS